MGFLSLFGDDSAAYGDYASELRALEQNFQPWVDAGKVSLQDLLKQYQQLTANPDFMQNQLAKNYQPSQYAQVQTDYLKNQLNNNAAVTGQLGSSYAAQTMGNKLQDLISKDENNYIQTGLGMYKTGLSGEQFIDNQGFNAVNSQTGLAAQADQADLQGENSKNAAMSALLGQGLSLGANFFTGGKGGLSTLIGGAGTKLLPASWLSNFDDPVIEKLKKLLGLDDEGNPVQNNGYAYAWQPGNGMPAYTGGN